MSKASNLIRRGVRYRYRLVAAMLLVSVPLMIGLAWLLTSAATSSLTSAAQDRGGNVARAVTLHLEDWVSERREQVTLVATEASGRLDDPAVARLLTGVQAAAQDFVVVQILDLRGNVVATSRPGFSLGASSQGWFRAASSGKPALTSMVARGDRIQWVMAEPILGPDGRPERSRRGGPELRGARRPAQPRARQGHRSRRHRLPASTPLRHRHGTHQHPQGPTGRRIAGKHHRQRRDPRGHRNRRLRRDEIHRRTRA